MDEERGVPDLGMWAVIWGWVAAGLFFVSLRMRAELGLGPDFFYRGNTLLLLTGGVAGLLGPALAGSEMPRVLAVCAGWAAAFCCAVLVFYLNCVLATEVLM